MLPSPSNRSTSGLSNTWLRPWFNRGKDQPVLNTAAVNIGNAWHLTTITDLPLRLSPSLIEWKYLTGIGGSCRTFLPDFKANSISAQNALDALSLSADDDMIDLRETIRIFEEWGSYYKSQQELEDLCEIWEEAEIKNIYFLAYLEKPQPFKQAISKNASNLYLISGAAFDIPLGKTGVSKYPEDFSQNIGYRNNSEGFCFDVFKVICWLEVITWIRCGDKAINVSTIQETTSQNKEVLIATTAFHLYFNEVYITFFGLHSNDEEYDNKLISCAERLGVGLDTYVNTNRATSTNGRGQVDLELPLLASDETAALPELEASDTQINEEEASDGRGHLHISAGEPLEGREHSAIPFHEASSSEHRVRFEIDESDSRDETSNAPRRRSRRVRFNIDESDSNYETSNAPRQTSLLSRLSSRLRARWHNYAAQSGADIDVLEGKANYRDFCTLLRQGILLSTDIEPRKGLLLTAIYGVGQKKWSKISRSFISFSPTDQHEIITEDTLVYFKIKRMRKDKVVEELLKSVGQEQMKAIFKKLNTLKVEGELAKGKVSLWKKLSAWTYLGATILCSILIISFNWADRKGILERCFSGMQFVTFALIGVFGLVKLYAKDESIIRNTFLGNIKLRTENDIKWYTQAKNIPFVLAMYDGNIDWAHEGYICYAKSRSRGGGIRINSGLDREHAKQAGLFPIGKTHVADLRTSEMRAVKDMGNNVLHITRGPDRNFNGDIQYFPEMGEERFFGPVGMKPSHNSYEE